MKRVISLLLCLAIISLPVFSFSEETSLSENEKNYLGSWVMYMNKNGKTYLYTITFFDDLTVILKTLSFTGSTLVSDNKSSGKWCGFTSGSIVLTLSGNDFAGMIRDDGFFGLYDFKTLKPSGFFSRCPDLSYMME